MNRLVNEQTEIGLLLALPGLLATMSLAPVILKLFYTHEFLNAVELIQWFVLGCLMRIISWPLGYVMLALGKGGVFLLIEISLKILEIAAIALGINYFGVKGVAIAFFAIAAIYLFTAHLTCHKLTGLTLVKSCARLIATSLVVAVLLFVGLNMTSIVKGQLFGAMLTIIGTFYCVRLLAGKLGTDRRLSRTLSRIYRD